MSSEGSIALVMKKRSDGCAGQATKNYMTRTVKEGGCYCDHAGIYKVCWWEGSGDYMLYRHCDDE